MSDINNADCFNCGCSCDNVACYTRNDTKLEKMQEEIENTRLERDNYFDALRDKRIEFQLLIAKHERLVKGLKEIKTYDRTLEHEIIEVDGSDFILTNDVLRLLTESEG